MVRFNKATGGGRVFRAASRVDMCLRILTWQSEFFAGKMWNHAKYGFPVALSTRACRAAVRRRLRSRSGLATSIGRTCRHRNETIVDQQNLSRHDARLLGLRALAVQAR